MLLAICLIISGPSSAATDIQLSKTRLGRAPTVAPMPDGLPEPHVAPLDGWWFQRESPELPEHRSGTYLPKPLDDHVMSRLIMLDQYPALCQAHLDAMSKIHTDEVEGYMAVTEARCTAQALRVEASKDRGYYWWQMLAIGISAAVVGVLGGMVLERVR